VVAREAGKASSLEVFKFPDVLSDILIKPYKRVPQKTGIRYAEVLRHPGFPRKGIQFLDGGFPGESARGAASS
jgi:hypothetical protein